MFWKYFIFSWSQFTQRLKGNFGQVLGNIKRCSDRNMAPIRQTIKSSLKLSKHSQVQPLHYSASAFQNFYNSTVKLRSTVFRNLLHFDVNHLRYTNFTDFLHLNVKSMRIIRPFLDKLRLWKKRCWTICSGKLLKKRNRCHSIPAQVILSISYYTKFSRIIFFFCTFLCF